jgi:hypothetical protein
MYDQRELEKRWREHKVKRYFRVGFFSVFVFIVTVVLYLYWTDDFLNKYRVVESVENDKKALKQNFEKFSYEEKRVDTLEVKEVLHDTIEHVEKRFQVTKSYDDALFLAKAYDASKVYEKVKYWALKANTLDSSREESWLLFAKAQFVLGAEEEAVEVLEVYRRDYYSPKVEVLLERMLKKMEITLVQ